MCVRRALCRRGGHRAVLEGDVIQGGDPVEHTQADLGQRDVEGPGEASQLHCDPVPAGPLVVQSPPYDSSVFHAVHLKVHVCSPHRHTGVIMPEGDEGEMAGKIILTVTSAAV